MKNNGKGYNTDGEDAANDSKDSFFDD